MGMVRSVVGNGTCKIALKNYLDINDCIVRKILDNQRQKSSSSYYG